jgi:hypothetical protein
MVRGQTLLKRIGYSEEKEKKGEAEVARLKREL